MGNSLAIKAYNSASLNNDVESLVKNNMDLVKKAVFSIAKNLPKYIEEEDLLQVGYIGLVKAAKNYTGENGAKFSTYAYYRIRGSIYDEIRSSDWKPRRAQKRTKLISQAREKLEADGVINIDDALMASQLDIHVDEYFEWVKETSLVKMVPMVATDGEHLDVQDKNVNIHTSLEKNELQGIISKSLKLLPTQSAQIVSLYYMDDMSFKDISFILDITPSYCARVFKKSLTVLKASLIKSGYDNG
jgi:RNA polymerase sigma factor for flagellar operon FliA